MCMSGTSFALCLRNLKQSFLNPEKSFFCKLGDFGTFLSLLALLPKFVSQ